MGEPYEYDRDELNIVIGDSLAAKGHVAVTVANIAKGKGFTILVPPGERQAASQALAGDEWRVVPADVAHGCFFIRGQPCGVCGASAEIAEWERELLEEPNRPEPVDPGPHAHEWIEDLDRCAVVGCDAVHPSMVRVGDVVEVTHSHGHAGLTIVITGEVYKVDDNPVHPFHLIGYGSPQIGDNTTVRWVRRAEPEPDPEQVEALTRVIGEVDLESVRLHKDIARDLIRRGVRVDGGTDG